MSANTTPQRPSLRQRIVALLSGAPERKESPVMAAIIASGMQQARWLPQTYESAVREGFARNSYVYTAISQIALALAGVAWKVYDDRAHTNELDVHPLKALIERPNPRQGKTQFLESVSAYLDLDGNCFIQCVGPRGKPPTELYALRPDRITILPGTASNPVAGYVYAVGNARVSLPTETIRHLKLFNPLDDFRGMSPMTAAAMSVMQSNSSMAWNVSLLQHGAQPPGAMSTTTALDPEQYQRLREQIQDEYSGFLNAGRTVILEGGLQWNNMGMSPVDMSWLEGQKMSARQIANVYGIDPALIGDSANRTYSNLRESRRALYQEKVLPRSDWIRDELNAWLSPMYDDNPYLDYDLDDIEALQEDQDLTSARTVKEFEVGLLRVNEARKAIGQDEDTESEWGDKYIFELPARSPAAPAASALPALPSAAAPLALPDGSTDATGATGVATTPTASTATESSAATPAEGGETPAAAAAASGKVVPFARGRLSTRLASQRMGMTRRTANTSRQ